MTAMTSCSRFLTVIDKLLPRKTAKITVTVGEKTLFSVATVSKWLLQPFFWRCNSYKMTVSAFSALWQLKKWLLQPVLALQRLQNYCCNLFPFAMILSALRFSANWLPHLYLQTYPFCRVVTVNCCPSQRFLEMFG